MDDDLHLDRLSDDALLDGIGAAVQNDNEQTAVLLRYVAEVDRRSLWQRCGHSSLFEFLVQRFHMSEAKAYRRIRAARAGREFPVLGLLAHEIPDGDPAKIVERAFDALLEKTLKRKAAITDTPREPATPRPAGSRHIPAQVRRAVWQRDGGMCAFVGEDGHRCNETRFVEFAHLEPWARGGAHTTDNVGLRCRVHNAYEAVRDYGPLFIARKIEAARGARESVAVYRRSGRPEPLPGVPRDRDWSCDLLGQSPRTAQLDAS